MLRFPSVKRSRNKVAQRRLSAIYATKEDVIKKFKTETEVLVLATVLLFSL